MAGLSADRRTLRSPYQLGYHMPAEWEPHEATWLAWPHQRSDWPGKFACIRWLYGEIVRQLATVERVRILIADSSERQSARGILKKCGANLDAIEFFRAPTNRSWIRDFGPIFLKNRTGQTALTSWRFNGWAKYDDWRKDDAATAWFAPKLNMPVWEPTYLGRPIVLEGGSIDVNGRGILLATEECLLSREQARNPGLGRTELEEVFRDYLGATRVLWLRHGIAGDDTHGHVDDLARFVSPTTVLSVVERDPSDVNYEPLQENLALLRQMKDERGHPLHVETLPMPKPVYFNGQRLPASYANFYLANRLVLVPTFNDANDRIALNTMARLFIDREVIGIACRDLVLGLGTLHCMTQQQPA